ncbi:ribonuclease R [Ignavibacteria bacterium CHB1]|nr:MAG: ribonuclease R [Chlorobiota bacterium]MBV6398297.1 Ribonuclease R [Ignavibacteria bacterium]MCE7952637.1 ribonuclease R [Chlorobi bacterium CHB7]MDL1886749.1 ribonuclease R [Ignavibacteria bacterium CHB1]RIK50275.1 MAG: ribonuclease R [Ignavibacteriota bacterium]
MDNLPKNNITKMSRKKVLTENSTKGLNVIKHVSGKFVNKGYYGIVIPDSKEIRRDIIIYPDDINGAENGDKIFCEILNPGDIDYQFSDLKGRIINVFGKAGIPDVEVQSVMAKYGLTKVFPNAVLNEVKNIVEQFDLEGRVDLREKLIFTIDPFDAKDFDDAISLESDKNGNYVVGVHIADVSFFVRKNSALDNEAFRRGTSVYLVDQVVPMLPEIISNDLCSLKPGVDRLTFSVFITLNEKCEIIDFKFSKSVINSKYRFTYEEVQQILDSGKGVHEETLRQMYNISKALTDDRINSESLDFDSKEIKFELDSKGKVKEIKIKPRLDSMRMIEEFMLLANKCATLYVSNRQRETNMRLPFIYRVHDDPDPDKISELNKFIVQFGYNLNISASKPGKKKLRKLLQLIKGKPEEYIINDLAIRSMAKAVYHEKNTGHYGLGFDDYTHFTSPIRRYPDLVVHRLLAYYLSEKPTQMHRDIVYNLKTVKEICIHSSNREQNAIAAEREIIKIKQIEYMKNKIGGEYEAVISGIIDRGLFVEIIDILVEGLIRFKDIEGDYFIYDEKNHYAYGRKTKKIYRAGDVVNVKLISVNIETRKLEFMLV